MIVFNCNSVIYNKIINNYLEIELFGNSNIGDKIKYYIPEYLYKEQSERCMETFFELYEWTGDRFYHSFSVFHEVILYYFLLEIDNIKDDIKDDFYEIYYTKSIKDEIEKCCKEDKEKGIYSNEEIKGFYYNPEIISSAIFEELDFAQIPYLYSKQNDEALEIAERMGINLDYYFEILPKDIKKIYKNKHMTLTAEIGEFFTFLQHRINEGSLADLFFENDKPINENKIHIILENMMSAYFIGKSVDISREVLLKNGKIDFKLFRSHSKNEKVLIEVKKASSSHLKAGYEKQLCEYIRYSGCKNAFYLIVCFSDNEYKKAINFIDNHVYTDNYQMYINIALLDVRKKLSPAKIK